MRIGSRPLEAAPSPWRNVCRTPRVREENGFTLIELIIVALVLPILIGAMTLSLIAIFSTQGSVSGRLQGSGDAQVISANYEKDVQSTALITTQNGSSGPLPARRVRRLESPGDPGSGIATGQWSDRGYADRNLLRGGPRERQSLQPFPQFLSNRQHYSATTTAISNNVASGLAATLTCDATLTGALASGTSYTSLNVSSLPDTVSAARRNS